MTFATRAANAAARYLTDVCTIVRADTAPTERTIDPTTLALDATSTTEIYTGPCLFTVPRTNPDTERAGQTVNVVSLECRIPITAAAVQPGDTVTCDTSDLNPDLTGTVGVVETVDLRSIGATRRLTVTVRDRTV